MDEGLITVVGSFQDSDHQTYPLFQKVLQSMQFTSEGRALVDLYEARAHILDAGDESGEIGWALHLASVLNANGVKMEKAGNPVFLKFLQSIDGLELNGLIHIDRKKRSEAREALDLYRQEASVLNSVSMYVDAVERDFKYFFTEIHAAFDIWMLNLPANMIFLPPLKHLSKAGLEARGAKVLMLFKQGRSIFADTLKHGKKEDFFDDVLQQNELDRHFNLSEMLGQYDYLKEKVKEYSKP